LIFGRRQRGGPVTFNVRALGANEMRHVYLLVFAIAFRSLAAAQVLHWIPDVPDHVGDFRGRVIDGISGQPISGVVVVTYWEMLDELPVPRVVGRGRLFDAADAMTDEDGQFVIPDLGKSDPPLTWKRDPTAYPRLWFYKTGYDYLALARGTWDSGTDPIRGEPLNPPELQRAHDASKGKLVVLYPNGRQPKHTWDQPARTASSADVAIAAASYLSGILWLVQDHSPSEERRMATKLARGISIVDTDIFRLTGKRHTWSPHTLNPAPRHVLKIKRPGDAGAPSAPVDNNSNVSDRHIEAIR